MHLFPTRRFNSTILTLLFAPLCVRRRKQSVIWILASLSAKSSTTLPQPALTRHLAQSLEVVQIADCILTQVAELSLGNCDHARACLLSIQFDTSPSGTITAEQFRAAVTAETGILFDASWAVGLLEIIHISSKFSSPVVVPNQSGWSVLQALRSILVSGADAYAFSVQCVHNGTYARFQRCVVGLKPDGKPSCRCSQYLSGLLLQIPSLTVCCWQAKSVFTFSSFSCT